MFRTGFFLLSLLLLVRVSLAQSSIVNGDFESWTGNCPSQTPPDGWTNYSTQLAPDEAGTCMGNVTAHGGDSYMNLVWIGVNVLEGASQNLQNLNMGSEYRIGFWGINSQGIYADPGDCVLQIHRNSTPIFSTPNLVSGGAWTYYSVDFTVTSPFEPIGIRCVGGASGTSGSAGVDDFAVTELVGVEDGDFVDVQVYPNPVRGGVLHVHVGDAVGGVNGTVGMEVVNVLGQRVMDLEGFVVSDGLGVLNLEGLGGGVYYLRVGVEGGMVVRRILVE